MSLRREASEWLNDFVGKVMALPALRHEAQWRFRGQENASWDLEPQIDREPFQNFRRTTTVDDYKTRVSHENHLLKDFRKTAIPNLPVPIGEDDWIWLAVAQHHGLATRLLDWTGNPLHALFFAVEREWRDPDTAKTTNSRVFFYRHSGSSWQSFRSEGPFCIPELVTFDPPYVSPRIPSQAGSFTAHPTTPATWKGSLEHVDVPGALRGPLRRLLLERFQISRGSLFPDLDGASARLNLLYSLLRDEEP